MISVVVPIYNKEKYIMKCVDSLLKQEGVELEIILVDDGSTDNSLFICKELERLHNNIIVISQKNAGVSVARNAGINFATGEWISFVDPDDYVEHFMYQALIDKSIGCDVVACCCYAVNNQSIEKNEFFSSDRLFETDEDKADLYCQLLCDKYMQPGSTFTAIGVPWGKLYKLSLLKENNLLFNPQLRRQQDNAFNMHVFDLAEKIFYLNKPLYYYQLDNVKNYYVSKYNGYAAKNALELQKERYEFFVSKNRMQQEKLKQAYDDETVCNIFGALNKDILHRHNSKSYKDRKKEYNQMISHDAFRKSIDCLDVHNVNGVFHKYVFEIIKLNFFWLLNVIWKSRMLYEVVRFKESSNDTE